MKHRLLIFVMLWACLPAAYAVLPRNSDFRQQEVFDYRQQKKKEFEKEQQQYETRMVSNDRQIRLELAASPWNGTAGGSAAAVKIDLTHSGQHRTGAGQPVKKWVFSIVALLFIGGCVWWVKVATEE
jgi:hypothetical protein